MSLICSTVHMACFHSPKSIDAKVYENISVKIKGIYKRSNPMRFMNGRIVNGRKQIVCRCHDCLSNLNYETSNWMLQHQSNLNSATSNWMLRHRWGCILRIVICRFEHMLRSEYFCQALTRIYYYPFNYELCIIYKRINKADLTVEFWELEIINIFTECTYILPLS